MWEKEKYCRSKLKIRILFFLMAFVFYTQESFSSSKDNILNNFSKINNMSFDFIQQIEEKIETGSCKIEYPKLLHCLYDNKDKKEITSNGRSLVIKNNRHNKSYIYPLKITLLKYILDKKFILDEIKKLEPSKINDYNVEFSISGKTNLIKVFFDIKTYDLAGWKTTDIYQEEVIFKISNIKKNILIEKNTFKLPAL